jgi:NADH:ubiquinone oxidoreductase subunit K
MSRFDTLLAEVPILFVAALWTFLAVATKQSYIGLAGLVILYRRYSKS